MTTAIVSNRQKGVSLIELSIYLVMVVLVLGGVFSIVFQSTVFSGENMRRMVIEQTGWRVLDRFQVELQSVDSTNVLPVVIADSNFVQYQSVQGYLNDAVQLGPTTMMRFEPEDGETFNGVDDNKDGRIDEGYIVLRRTGSNPERIAGNILGLRFNTMPGGLTYSVDIGLTDREGNLIQRTFTEQITFRN